MLKNVVGLVTGGASGLGRATVERLVKEGARVTLAGIHFTFTRNLAASGLSCSPPVGLGSGPRGILSDIGTF